MSKKFYYHKDKYGQEKAYEVFNVQKDAAQRLELMGDDAACAVEYIHEGDFAGYSSLDEYIANDGADAWSAAVQEGLDAGLAFPFCLVRHQDGTFETLAKNAVDYVEIADEYEDFGHWRVQPGYYDSADITPAEAEKQGLYELARVMREEKVETISCSIGVWTKETSGQEDISGIKPYKPRGQVWGGPYGDTVEDLPDLFEQLKAEVPDLTKPWTFTVHRLYGKLFDQVTLYFNYWGKNVYIADVDADDELIAAVEALNTGCRRVPQLAEKYIFAPEDAVFDFDEFNRQIKLRDILEDAREANG